MTETMFLLGAGFSRSVMDPRNDDQAPLVGDFFQKLLASERMRDRLHGLRMSPSSPDGARGHLDSLFAAIKYFWHLTEEDLRETPFDIEECLTLFESLLEDPATTGDPRVVLSYASRMLRLLLLMVLDDLELSYDTPAKAAFAAHVHETRADTITFNYDRLADLAIERHSGFGTNQADMDQRYQFGAVVSDADLVVSNHGWKRTLASGFKFDEVMLPTHYPTAPVRGDRYYSHPANALYTDMRVLKLHGSVDWQRYSHIAWDPFEVAKRPTAQDIPHDGIVLNPSGPGHFLARPPTFQDWTMEAVIIPPLLNKPYADHPFPALWPLALSSLQECRHLVIIGYSFPPTDFRTRRLFMEAFAEHDLASLTVVDPYPGGVTERAMALTHYRGKITIARDLAEFYDVEPFDSFFGGG